MLKINKEIEKCFLQLNRLYKEGKLVNGSLIPENLSLIKLRTIITNYMLEKIDTAPELRQYRMRIGTLPLLKEREYSPSNLPILKLPDEILIHIFSYFIERKTFIACFMVCYRFSIIAWEVFNKNNHYFFSYGSPIAVTKQKISFFSLNSLNPAYRFKDSVSEDELKKSCSLALDGSRHEKTLIFPTLADALHYTFAQSQHAFLRYYYRDERRPTKPAKLSPITIVRYKGDINTHPLVWEEKKYEIVPKALHGMEWEIGYQLMPNEMLVSQCEVKTTQLTPPKAGYLGVPTERNAFGEYKRLAFFYDKEAVRQHDGKATEESMSSAV